MEETTHKDPRMPKSDGQSRACEEPKMKDEDGREEMRGRVSGRRGGRGGASYSPTELSPTPVSHITTSNPDDDQKPPQHLRPQHKSDTAALNVASDFLDPEELRALHASVNAGTEPLDALPSGSLRSAALSQPDVRGFVLGTEARQLYRTLRVLGIEVLATFNLLRLAHRKEDFEHAEKHQDILFSSSSSSDDDANSNASGECGAERKKTSTSYASYFWRLSVVKQLRRGARVLYHFTLGKANSARAVYTNTIFEEWTKTFFFGVFHATAATISISAALSSKRPSSSSSYGDVVLPPRVFVTLVAYCASSLFTSLLRHCAAYLLAVYHHHDNHSLFSTDGISGATTTSTISSRVASTFEGAFTKPLEALLMPGTSSPSGLAMLLTRQFLQRYVRDERHNHTIIAQTDLLSSLASSRNVGHAKLINALQIVPHDPSTVDDVGVGVGSFIHLPSHLQASYFPQTPEELLQRIDGCKVFVIDGATSVQRHNEFLFTYRRVAGAVRDRMRRDEKYVGMSPTKLALPSPPPPFEILGGFSMKLGIYFDKVCYSYPTPASGGDHRDGGGCGGHPNIDDDAEHEVDTNSSSMVRYYALDGVSAFLPAGTMTGIKGVSGGGKSTLMKMVLKAGAGGGSGRDAGGCVYSRRWESTTSTTILRNTHSGTDASTSSQSPSIKYISPSGIYIDGVPSECFNHQYLRSRIAFVPQPQIGGVALTSSSGNLNTAQNVYGDVAGLVVVDFSTIAESLAFPANAKLQYGSTDSDNNKTLKSAITLSDVQAAAKLCNSHDLIMKLPHGYNTQLERNGTELTWRVNNKSSPLKNARPSTSSGTNPMAQFEGPPGLPPPSSSSGTGTSTTGAFSSGEEQRLLLTQALLYMTFCSTPSNDATIKFSEMFLLLLDEPTSRLDAENEHHFVSAINKIVGTPRIPLPDSTSSATSKDTTSSPPKPSQTQVAEEDSGADGVGGVIGGGVTVVCVSHRPSTLKGASTIITVNNGQVAI